MSRSLTMQLASSSLLLLNLNIFQSKNCTELNWESRILHFYDKHFNNFLSHPLYPVITLLVQVPFLFNYFNLICLEFNLFCTSFVFSYFFLCFLLCICNQSRLVKFRNWLWFALCNQDENLFSWSYRFCVEWESVFSAIYVCFVFVSLPRTESWVDFGEVRFCCCFIILEVVLLLLVEKSLLFRL